MARAQRAERAEGSAAGRVAARRRDTSRDGRGAGAARAPTVKRRTARADVGGGSALRRGLRLVVLMAVMALIGFFAVLVVDVSASLVGRLQFGNTTLSGLWDKVVDRVLDRDVPRLPDGARARGADGPVDKGARKSSPQRSSPSPAPSVGRDAERAPVPAAPTPEEDARHVERAPRPDPQVEQARRRLDDLLKRL